MSCLSGISQSMIAKIESGNIQPSYLVVDKILTVLDSLENKNTKKCKDIMTKKVISIDLNKKVEDASKIMRELSISQIPVMDGSLIVGVVSENILLDKLSSNVSSEDLMKMRVCEVMENVLPMVGLDNSVNSIIELVKENSAVIVMDKEKIKGIISKTDLLWFLTNVFVNTIIT